MMVTCHSKMLLSSTSPAENPSTGFFVSSVASWWARWCMILGSSRALHRRGCGSKECTPPPPLSCLCSSSDAWSMCRRCAPTVQPRQRYGVSMMQHVDTGGQHSCSTRRALKSSPADADASSNRRASGSGRTCCSLRLQWSNAQYVCGLVVSLCCTSSNTQKQQTKQDCRVLIVIAINTVSIQLDISQSILSAARARSTCGIRSTSWLPHEPLQTP